MGDETRRGTMVRVLGPVDLLTGAGTVPVGGRMTRALLGALVVGAGHAVPVDQLREALWHGDEPDAADSTLQSYVSALRHLLGAEAIARTDHSYELDLDRVDVDALEFERLLRRADQAGDDPDERWRLSREALALWRGQPFGDLGDDDPFRLEAYRLDELRLAAMELNLGADLVLGRHELVVAELESAVEEHPYRERLWYLLVRALALGDRRVEALRRCSELRRVLGETGIGVSAEIVELERAILDGTLHGSSRLAPDRRRPPS